MMKLKTRNIVIEKVTEKLSELLDNEMTTSNMDAINTLSKIYIAVCSGCVSKISEKGNENAAVVLDKAAVRITHLLDGDISPAKIDELKTLSNVMESVRTWR